MKIIDLLNKIANEKEVPKKIKYNDKIFIYDGFSYIYENKTFNEYNRLEEFISYGSDLNDEVEILEEEPYIEICGRWFTKSEYNEFVKDEEEKKIPEPEKDILHIDDLITPVDENMYKIWKQAIKNHNKINEIIDYLKSKGE